MADKGKVDFTFSWRALNLLGQGLYSNPWSALSELVANGFDARATDVHVYLDMRNSAKANIEIFDNGTGMDRDQLETYAKVGFNKRSDLNASQPSAAKPMGRKGIGKLAALYLTETFYIRTRVEGSEDTSWLLDASASNVELDTTPALQQVDELPPLQNLRIWESYRSGTFLSLRDVDLSGHGTQAFASLGTRLANQFSLEGSTPQRRIMLFVHTQQNGTAVPVFTPAEKKIAFGNFVFMSHRGSRTMTPAAPANQLSRRVFIPAPGLASGQHEARPERVFARLVADTEIEGWKDVAERVDLKRRRFDDISFNISGWVGLHATINKSKAHANDERFEKNKFYNPAQLRLYVRGKLASDRLLSQLGITSTYMNYIEGEISFDLLDDDSFADIATSNRQDFDETDDRVILLRALVRPMVRELIARRNRLAAQIADIVKSEKLATASAGKGVFSRQLQEDLEGLELTASTRATIQNIAVNKLVGDATTKEKFRVFISHSSKDAAIGNFIYQLLLNQGVDEEEIFYTSKPNDASQYDDKRPLPVVIKENITDFNTQIFYLTSRHFTSSEYCLFEGGAGWATRAVNTLLKLNVEFAAVPDFLTEGNLEMQMLNVNKELELRGDLYNHIVSGVLNPMIAHINHGRFVAGRPILDAFAPAKFPDPMTMASLGHTVQDYYEKTILDHWEFYIAASSDAYLAGYPHP